MTWAKTIMSKVKETEKADNKVAVFASRPLNCSTAREMEETLFTLDSIISSLDMYANYWKLSETKKQTLLKQANSLNKIRNLISDAPKFFD